MSKGTKLHTEVGKIYKTKNGQEMKIVEYINYDNVVIEFEDGNQLIRRMSEIRAGNVRNPYYKNMYGVGFLGEGIANSKYESYPYWNTMLRKCYYENKGTVCEEWHNYQNFHKWFEENYYKVDSETMMMSNNMTDLNNTIYSPQTVIFVPSKIFNMLKYKRYNKNSGLPAGVTIPNKNYPNRYAAAVCRNLINGEKRKFLGYFDTPEKAAKAYKNEKEKYIKEIAEIYKDKISNKLYNALLQYKL